MTIWISDHSLTVDKMMENAQYVLNDLLQSGWTKESICGMLGNMKRESTVNPGLWQNYPAHSGGYGLVQWTPSTNYTDWANGLGIPVENMDSELYRIKWELQNGEQYYSTDAFPMTFLQFTQSTSEPGYLAECFMLCYERPGDPALQERIDAAIMFYNTLVGGVNENDPDLPIENPDEQKPKKIFLFRRYFRR